MLVQNTPQSTPTGGKAGTPRMWRPKLSFQPSTKPPLTFQRPAAFGTVHHQHGLKFGLQGQLGAESRRT